MIRVFDFDETDFVFIGLIFLISLEVFIYLSGGMNFLAFFFLEFFSFMLLAWYCSQDKEINLDKLKKQRGKR